MFRTLFAAAAGVLILTAPVPALAQTAGQIQVQTADMSARIRAARQMSANRAFQADAEARQKAIQADVARLQAAPPIMIANGDTVIQAPQTGGFRLGQGLVINNTQMFVNIQNGNGNSATNTLVSTSLSGQPKSE